jgi:hypothetical protein
MKDYGLGYSLLAYVFIAMSFAQLFRLALYLITMVYHFKVFGYFE